MADSSSVGTASTTTAILIEDFMVDTNFMSGASAVAVAILDTAVGGKLKQWELAQQASPIEHATMEGRRLVYP